MSKYNPIEMLSACYREEKRRLREVELGVTKCSAYILESSEKIVNTIEESVKYLNEQDGFIITNEVIKGKKGHWYQGYMSESTYYRHRKSAYDAFLRKLH